MSQEKHRVWVKPGSAKGPLVEADADGLLTVWVAQRAVDGAANEAVIRALADYWAVRRADVTIAAGHASRHKTVVVRRP